MFYNIMEDGKKCGEGFFLFLFVSMVWLGSGWFLSSAAQLEYHNNFVCPASLLYFLLSANFFFRKPISPSMIRYYIFYIYFSTS